jgi:hypothetical protein
MLVLMMALIYEVHNWDGLRWHGMHTKFYEDWHGHSANIAARFLVSRARPVRKA